MKKKLLRNLLAFILLTVWLLSGWPQIFNFPPKMQEVQAATCGTPTITLAGGPYTGIQSTTITGGCGGGTICYTTDGATPGATTTGTCDSDGHTQTYSGGITIDYTMTIKTISTKSKSTNSAVASSAYTITVNMSTFGTNGGSFDNDTSSTILDSFTGATICYTTDGAMPGATTAGTCDSDGHTQTYSTAVAITATGTVLKAIGTKSGSTNSIVATSNSFTLTVGVITSSPGAGTYSSTQSVTLNIANTTGATAHYTTDGSAVSCSSTTYSGAFNVSTTTTVKAIGCKTNYVSDSAISDLYTIAIISVAITPAGDISYGIIEAGQSKSTIDLSATKTSTNDGNTTENLNIKTSNATGGTQWTLGATPGTDIFVHEFSINGGAGWTAFTTADSYQILATGIAASGTQNFDLRITVPNTSSDYQQKTITVTVQAVAQ